MSWAEVKKINSDFINEPLNFNNYINDISIFGSESYVLDIQNKSLYRDLIANSLAVFGHTAIHEYIYDRLTQEDVDYMLVANGRLGQALNSFYRCDKFTKGGIDQILRTMTADSYNMLGSKFQHGINRYIEGFVSKSTGVGLWFDSIFGLNNEILRDKNTLADIVNDDNMLELFLANESIRMALCCNMTIQNISTSDETFKKLLVGIASTSPSTITLLKTLGSQNKLTSLFNDEEACRILVTHEESLRAIIKDVTAFAIAMESESFFHHLVTSSTAINIILEAMVDCSKMSDALRKAQTELAALRETVNGMPLIHNAVKAIDTAREINQDCITAMDKIFSTGGEMVKNFNELLASNPTTLQILCNSKAFLCSIINHKNVFELEYIIRNDKRWHDALIQSSLLKTHSWSNGDSQSGHTLCSNKCIVVGATLYNSYGWAFRYVMRNDTVPTTTHIVGVVPANYYDMTQENAKSFDRIYATDTRFAHSFTVVCNATYSKGTTNTCKWIDLGE